MKAVKNEMNYRKLTKKEIRLFIEDHARYERWASYKVYALYVYGSQAVRIVVESGFGYGNRKTKKSITAISVYNKDGKKLEPDWTNGWWQPLIANRLDILTGQSWNSKDWTIARRIAIEESQRNLPIPPQQDDFNLQTPPLRRFPTVYVQEE